MTPYDEGLIEAVQLALLVTLKVSAPILGIAVVIGLVISILQSITQIQEQTIIFVPKIVGMALVAIALMNWIAERLMDFAVTMFTLV